MFTFENLSDYEFEDLCRDVLSVRLNMKMYVFPCGRDGGIDLCDDIEKSKVVAQIKHYSDYKNLLSALKGEKEKVKKLAPERYIVCTSLPLSRTRRQEIFALFAPYMQTADDVIDGIEIDAFLAEKSHMDIVNRHYKLWLTSSVVLGLMQNRDVFLDCEELLERIKGKMSLYVCTQSFYEAKKVLEKFGVVLLIGAPGIGKSTISEMLILDCVREEYAIRYSSENDIAALKRVISVDPQKKEVIILDDFLGQHYLKIDTNVPRAVQTLVSFVKRNPAKRLILNSRITILNEAKQQSEMFERMLDDNVASKYLIDTSSMTAYERAEILYNHLRCYKVPLAYLQSIRKKQAYMSIIEHKNYNPRIIEYAARRYAEAKSPDAFYAYIKHKLDKPNDVWKDEFRNRLGESDRILMNTLYSLSDGRIECSALEHAFIARIQRDNRVDTSDDPFQNSIKRLNGSLITVSMYSVKEIFIGVINPSVNDYLREAITENVAEQIRIIESAISSFQPTRVNFSLEASKKIRDMIVSGEFLRLCGGVHCAFSYLRYVVLLKIKDHSIDEHVRYATENFYRGNIRYMGYEELIRDLFTEGYIDYYGLMDVFLDPDSFSKIFDDFNYELLLLLCNGYFAPHQSVRESLKKRLCDAMSEYIAIEVGWDVSNALANECFSFYMEDGGFDEWEMERRGEEIALEMIEDRLEKECMRISPLIEFEKDLPYSTDVLYLIDMYQSVQQAIESSVTVDDDDGVDEVDDEESKIAGMFTFRTEAS